MIVTRSESWHHVGELARSLTSPPQRNRPRHRVLHLSTRALRLQVCRLQLEIPFCGAVRVVDQHEMWIVLQTFGLQFHGAAVLFDELGEDEFQQLGAEGHPAEDVPSGDYVDAASVAGDGSDRGET